MDVYVDAFFNDGDNSNTTELMSATKHDIFTAMSELADMLLEAGHSISHFEIWPRNEEPDEPTDTYTLDDVNTYFTSGMKNCKSIW